MHKRKQGGTYLLHVENYMAILLAWVYEQVSQCVYINILFKLMI